eukprot:15567732-Heterocapsa_arctica.AAC.1
MEGPRLDKRHRLDRPRTNVGGHIPRLRCSWEDDHAKLGMRKHKCGAQEQEMYSGKHLSRTKQLEKVEDKVHMEKDSDIMNIGYVRTHN